MNEPWFVLFLGSKAASDIVTLLTRYLLSRWRCTAEIRRYSRWTTRRLGGPVLDLDAMIRRSSLHSNYIATSIPGRSFFRACISARVRALRVRDALVASLLLRSCSGPQVSRIALDPVLVATPVGLSSTITPAPVRGSFYGRSSAESSSSRALVAPIYRHWTPSTTISSHP